MLRNTVMQGPCKLVKRNYCDAYLLWSKNSIHPETKNSYMATPIQPLVKGCSPALRTCFRSIKILSKNICGYQVQRFSTSALRFSDDPKKRDMTDTLNKSIVKKLQHMEDSLRYHGYSTIRIGLFFVFTLGMSVYIFREAIRENVADEVSQVATRSLEDQMVVGKAEQFAKGLLDAILNDEQMTRLAAEFVVGVLQRDETKQSTAKVLMSVIDDPITREHLIIATKQVFLAALYDESTQTALKVVFKKILADPETRQAAKDLLAYVFAEDDIKNLVADFFKDVIRMDIVVRQATELGKDVTHNVISDPSIQQETGDTIWRAFTHSITPRWFGGSTPPPTPTKETITFQTETTSPETGETWGTDPSVEGVDMDTASVTSEEQITKTEEERNAIKDKTGVEEIKEEQDNEQKEIVENTNSSGLDS